MPLVFLGKAGYFSTMDTATGKLAAAKARAEKVRAGIFERLRSALFTGIIVTVPIVLTLYIAWRILMFADSLVDPLIPPAYNPNHLLLHNLPGLGLVIVVLFFIVVGVLAKNFFGRVLIRISEAIVTRLPVVSPIYKGVKQVFETIMSDHASAFREVVLVEFPGGGMWALGFVTGATVEKMKFLAGDEMVNVLLPSALSPTCGLVLFVPRKKLRVIDMHVEEAFRLIISGGMVPPPPEAVAVAKS